MIGKPGQVYNLGPLSIQFVDVFFFAMNAPLNLRHKLDSPDTGWIPVSKDQFCDIKEGPLPRARDSITLMCDTDPVRATIMVIAANIGKR